MLGCYILDVVVKKKVFGHHCTDVALCICWPCFLLLSVCL